MNVLKFMRSSAILKYLLWLVILSFILWIFAFYGGGRQTSNKSFGPDYVVKVKDRTMPPQTLSLALQFQRDRIRSMLGEEYVEQFMKDAHKNVVSGFVDSLILSYLADDYGLSVSEAEVADSIEKTFKFQDPKTQYPMMLQMRGVTSGDFEALWKTDLTKGKVMGFISSKYIFSDKEIEDKYKDEKSKFKAKIVMVKSNSFLKEVGEVTDADARVVYEREKGTLTIKERRSLKYLLVSAPSIRASLEIPDADIQAYYDSHKEKFGEKPFDQVKGQVKNVMLFGDKALEGKVTETFEKAKEEFRKATSESEIQAFADKYKLKISTVTAMEKENPQPPISMAPDVVEKIFKSEKGQWSDTEELQSATLKFCVTEITEPRPATYEDVRDKIKQDLKNERTLALAKKAAYELKAFSKGDVKALEDEAKKRQFQVQDSGEISIVDSIPMIGKDKNAAKQIFDSSLNEVSGPIEVKDGFALSVLLEKKPADMQKFKTEKAGFVEQMAQKEAQSFLDDYLSRTRQELEAKGEININKEIMAKYEVTKES